MKRVYRTASVCAAGNGFGIMLDAKRLLSPAKQPFAVPSRPLAEAIAEEWQAQGPALRPLTTTSGSLVIALAVLEGELDAEGAFGASQLDESFQIEQWGEDYEAAERRAALKADIGAAARFVALLRS